MALELGRLAATLQRHLQEGNYHAAIPVAESITKQLPSPRAYTTLASLYRECCRIPEALTSLDQAIALEPANLALRLRRTLLLPPMMLDRSSIQQDRSRILQGLTQLLKTPLRLEDPLAQLPVLDFFLAYHGENDRPIRELLGKVLLQAAPSLGEQAPHLKSPHRMQGRRTRIGFFSSYFRDHTIGRLNEARLIGMNRAEFEIFTIFPGEPGDAFARRLSSQTEHAVIVPRKLTEARQQLAALELDLLLYTDLGMDPFSYLLAFSRSAHVQATTWGHPVSSGLSSIDWFLSSELLDPPGNEAHYSEKLYRLPLPGLCYTRPVIPEGYPALLPPLPAGCPFYLCPQSLFKLHPDFDEVLAGILAEDPIGILGLLAPARAEWAERVEQRLDRLFPGSSRRIFWIPALSQEDFLRLLAHATVILDPFPFGGGNTSLEALAASAPVVTLPSAFLRGRLTLAWYKSLNLENQPLVVVHSPAAYIQAATTLARNPTVRQSLQSQIQETSPMLFNRKDMITAFEQFCRDVLA